MNKQRVFNFSQGLQHVLAMYAGSVAVPLIIGAAWKLSAAQMTLLIAADLLACGVATLLQAINFRGVGIGLPVVLGTTFTAVSPVIAIGLQYDIPTAFGAMLVSGLFVLLNARFFGQLSALFPPVVVGSVVTIIGATLAPVALNNAAGGIGAPGFGTLSNFMLAGFTLLMIIIFSRFMRGFMQTIAVLLGIVAGTIAAAFSGCVDVGAVNGANWAGLVEPLAFGAPKFVLLPIITMCIVALVSQVESAGVFIILSDICGKSAGRKDLARGFRAEGLAVIFASLFNSFPKTTFSQNVGLVELTGVRRTAVMFYAGIILVMLSLLPKFAALVLAVPAAVLGGAMIAMFGMVAVAGIRTIARADMTHTGNMLVVACSLMMGIGVASCPQAFKNLPEWTTILTGSGIISGSVTAVALNLIIGDKNR